MKDKYEIDKAVLRKKVRGKKWRVHLYCWKWKHAELAGHLSQDWPVLTAPENLTFVKWFTFPTLITVKDQCQLPSHATFNLWLRMKRKTQNDPLTQLPYVPSNFLEVIVPGYNWNKVRGQLCELFSNTWRTMLVLSVLELSPEENFPASR